MLVQNGCFLTKFYNKKENGILVVIFFRKWGLFAIVFHINFFLHGHKTSLCSLVYQVSLNFVIHIAHLSFHTPSQPHSPLLFLWKPHTPTNPPYHFNNPRTTHQLPLPTPSLSCKFGAPTQHFPNPPKIMFMQDHFPLPFCQAL